MLATVKIIPFAVPRDVLARGARGHRRRAADPRRAARGDGRPGSSSPGCRRPSRRSSTRAARRCGSVIEALGSRLGEAEVVDHAVGGGGARRRASSSAVGPQSHPHVRRLGDRRPRRCHTGGARRGRRRGGPSRHAGRSRQSADAGQARRCRRSSAFRPAPARPRSTASTGCWRACSPASMSRRQDIMDMGAGGLLMEIASRPAPREGSRESRRRRRSPPSFSPPACPTRMGSNKLLEDVRGKADDPHDGRGGAHSRELRRSSW